MYATLSSYMSFDSDEKEYYNTSESGSFMYVFIGTMLAYMKDSIHQIRLWNNETPIYVCVTRSEENIPFIDTFKLYNVHIIYLDELQSTQHHDQFHKVYHNHTRNNFWKYTMERFFYVEECMKKYDLQNVFHLEFDNLLYFRINDILHACSSRNKILVPSDNETRCIAGTCFIPNSDILKKLNEFFATNVSTQNEMEMMMQFYKLNLDSFEGLPVVPPEYSHPLIPIEGEVVIKPPRLYNTTTIFGGVFDAAAIGQYIGGIDPIHNENNTDGFISTHSAFQVDKLWFKWKNVNELHQLHMSADKITWYPIYNLHIHNKNMSRWISDIPKKPHLDRVIV